MGIAACAGTLNSKGMRLRVALLLTAFCLGISPRLAHADQQHSGVEGTVADSLGNLLSDVQVGLVGTPHFAITDEKGEFKLPQVKAGNYTLSMKRLGYAPISMAFAMLDDRGVTLDFEMTATAVRLAPLSIKAERLSSKLRRVGFADRMKTGGAPPSHFVTRQELEKNHYESLQRVVDKLGGRAKTCDNPTLFLDGLPYSTFLDIQQNPSQAATPRILSPGASQRMTSTTDNAGGFQRPKPLENFDVRAIDGMEIYFQSEVPAEYRRQVYGVRDSKCVIVLWTRDR